MYRVVRDKKIKTKCVDRIVLDTKNHYFKTQIHHNTQLPNKRSVFKINNFRFFYLYPRTIIIGTSWSSCSSSLVSILFSFFLLFLSIWEFWVQNRIVKYLGIYIPITGSEAPYPILLIHTRALLLIFLALMSCFQQFCLCIFFFTVKNTLKLFFLSFFIV